VPRSEAKKPVSTGPNTGNASDVRERHALRSGGHNGPSCAGAPRTGAKTRTFATRLSCGPGRDLDNAGAARCMLRRSANEALVLAKSAGIK
jgi:hypothetical protein